MTEVIERRRSAPRRSTIQDVARVAGVAVGTVSRVTSNNPTVDPAIREKVLSAIAMLGYRPNAVAQSMRKLETRLIGCLIADFSNPFYAAVLRSAESVLALHGYTLLIASTDDSSAREVALIEMLASRRADALIAVPSSERDPALLRAFRLAGIPLVAMERSMGIAADSVVTDHRGGMREATEHLICLGHRRIALVTGSRTTRSGRDRVAGYRDALAAANIALDPALVRSGSLAIQDAVTETSRWLASRRAPSAIIAGGNRLLTGVLQAIRAARRSVPGDISVISTGDTDLAEYADPPITVTRWDLAAFGRTVAETVLARLADRTAPPRQIVLQSELVLRRSCAPPRGFAAAVQSPRQRSP